MNVKEGFEGLYQMGDKSGIWRFYGRVCKNIFYERRDKERERGFLGMGGKGKFVFFLKCFKGWRRIRNFMGECIFGIMGWIFGLRRRRNNILNI